MNIKKALRELVPEIISDMNEELLQDRIIRFWKRKDANLTLREFVDKYWEDKSEFAVDLGVSFGKIFEFYLPIFLSEKGYPVEPKFTSKGDMKITVNGKESNSEIKTGRGKFIQGATHSPKEKDPLNLIQVLWDCYWDKTLNEILEDGQFISEMNICVFENVVVDSVGEHSNNNSRTTLRFPKSLYNTCLDACIFGSIKENRVNVGFVKQPVNPTGLFTLGKQ